jgi:integrase
MAEPNWGTGKKITDIAIRALQPPPSGQRFHADDSLPGFGVRVSAGGTKTFVLNHGRERERITLGRYPTLTLADARAEAKRIQAERTLGALRPQPMKVKEALSQYLTSHVEQKCAPRTQKEIKRLMTKHVAPKLGERPLGDIRTQDVTRILDKLLATPAECDHVFRASRAFFRWAVRRRLLPHSPLEGLERPVKPVSRERVLSDPELAVVLRQADGAGDFGLYIRLLILTGQRKTEIVSLTRDMIDSGGREINLSITKNGRPASVPYGDSVAAILDMLPADGCLFRGRTRGTDTNGERQPFNGFSKATERFREACGLPHWTLHDLRRTFATGMQRLGMRLEVTEALLNHMSGSRGGIVGVYQRHAYKPEKREAMLLWERHVLGLSQSSA